MKYPRNLTRLKFGKLTVIEQDLTKPKGHGTYWKCKCDCGNEIIVRRDELTSKGRSHCGCENYHNLLGKRFGRLTVIERKPKDENHEKMYWICQCDCGNLTEAYSYQLERPYKSKKSCVCLAKELTEKAVINEVGNVYGYWKVLERAYRSDVKDTNAYWKCKCLNCGTISIINGNALRTGRSKSCGCIKSWGETNIAKVLTEAGIPFEKQKTFDTCIFEDTNYPAYFDFYVDNKYIIEFDGIQHIQATNSGWNTEENFEKIKKHDNIKNQWCKNNNLPLIRIPFYKRDNIKLEDLLIETTTFLWKESE